MKEGITLSSLVLDGEEVKFQTANIFIEIMPLEIYPQREWEINVEMPHIEVLASKTCMDIEATDVEGNKYSGNGFVSEITSTSDKQIKDMTIQGNGKLKIKEIA